MGSVFFLLFDYIPLPRTTPVVLETPAPFLARRSAENGTVRRNSMGKLLTSPPPWAQSNSLSQGNHEGDLLGIPKPPSNWPTTPMSLCAGKGTSV